MKQAEKKFIGSLIPIGVDLLVLGLFYLSIHSVGTVQFMDKSILPYVPLLIQFILLGFFSVLYYLLFTSDNVRDKIAEFWLAPRRIISKPVQWISRAVIWSVLLIYGFLHFIAYIVVIVMGAAIDPDVVAPWLAAPLSIFLMISVLAFAVLLTFLGGGPDDPAGEQERAQKKLYKELPHRPFWYAIFFGLASVVLPVYTFWMYLTYVTQTDYKTAVKTDSSTRRTIWRWLDGLFGIIFLTILHFELTTKVVSSAPEALGRAAMLFIFLYLPLKFFVLLVHKARLPLLVELIWAGLFFVAQLAIVYTTF